MARPKKAIVWNVVAWRGLLLILWMGVIFAFSAMPGSPYPWDPTWSYYLERKGAHVFEYAILTLLAVRFLRAVFPGTRFRSLLAYASLFSLCYAASDEWHQSFVPYRGARVTDVLIDLAGILLAAGILLFLERQARPTSPSRLKR